MTQKKVVEIMKREDGDFDIRFEGENKFFQVPVQLAALVALTMVYDRETFNRIQRANHPHFYSQH